MITKPKNIHIVIPARDEAMRIGAVLDRIRGLGYQNVLVVDDGSNDHTAAVAHQHGAKVISHPINLGPGGATRTGIEAVLDQGAEIVVTMDGDGQHFPEDIEKLILPIERGETDIVIGSRFLDDNNKVPGIRRLYNIAGNLVTMLMTGIYMTDTQSGMKAFSAPAAGKMKIRLNGYAFCTEIIMFIGQHKLSFREVPIQVVYTKETMQKGQSFRNGLRMLGAFLQRILFLNNP